jgi:hypothetical protein
MTSLPWKFGPLRPVSRSAVKASVARLRKIAEDHPPSDVRSRRTMTHRSAPAQDAASTGADNTHPRELQDLLQAMSRLIALAEGCRLPASHAADDPETHVVNLRLPRTYLPSGRFQDDHGRRFDFAFPDIRIRPDLTLSER